VHISALSNKFVDDPRKVVNPGDQVSVKVLKVDKEKNQISLTMRLDEAPEHKAPRDMKSTQPAGAGPRRDGPSGGRPQQGGGPRRDQPRHDRGGDRGQDRDQRGGGRPAGNPFNNPFAALMNINDKK